MRISDWSSDVCSSDLTAKTFDMLQVFITALLSTAVEFFETLAIAYALARAGYRREAIVGTMIGQLLIVFVALVSPWPAAVLPVTALRALAAALLMATGLYWSWTSWRRLRAHQRPQIGRANV